MQTSGQFGTRRHQIRAGSTSYDVQLTAGSVGTCCESLLAGIGGRKALIVTTPTVSTLYASEIFQRLCRRHDCISFLVLECNESTKSLELVAQVCKKAIEISLDRKGLLVGIGGGVCLDIVTFAASWIRRGVCHIRVPTTLIGQIDAGVGIKGAVNFAGKKNYLGCYYPPESVIVVPSFLASLSRNHISEGFAEIIKIALVRDPQLFELVEEKGVELLDNQFYDRAQDGKEILWRSIVGMMSELEPNLYEDKTYERLVDFGHTFSPGLESASDFETSHGEAVSIDMALSVVLATELGLLDSSTRDRILKALMHLDLPVWTRTLTVDRCVQSLRDCALHRGGQPNLVLPMAIGGAAFIKDTGVVVPHLGRALLTLGQFSRNVPAWEAPLLNRAAEA
jgi:3-dehydroquinate synthetase